MYSLHRRMREMTENLCDADKRGKSKHYQALSHIMRIDVLEMYQLGARHNKRIVL